MPLAATTVLGIAGIVLSLPAWFYFLRGAVRLYRLIASGKPDPGHIPRINRPVRRLITLIKETVFHTELMRKPVVAVAHWCVMVGFLIGSSVWFEAYIQTFNPAGGWPIISDWPLYHLAEAGTLSKTETNNLSSVDYKAKKYGKSSYLLVLEGLTPGEYGIVIGDPNHENTKDPKTRNHFRFL